MSGEPSATDASAEALVPAPGWRRLLAGIADAAIATGAAWLWRRWAGEEALARRARLAPLLGAAGELLREQLASPGQLLLGVRTVDCRTGRRVELWRSGARLAIAAASRAGVTRLAPASSTPEREREREQFVQEMQAILRRHPEDSPQRDAEREALFARQGHLAPFNVQHPLVLSLAVGVVDRRLRRRVVRTTEVLAGARTDHSP